VSDYMTNEVVLALMKRRINTGNPKKTWTRILRKEKQESYDISISAGSEVEMISEGC